MKKIIMMMLICMPIMAYAGGDDSKYLDGAVPEENGIVLFQKSFSIPQKSKAEIYTTIKGYLQSLVANSIEAPTAYARLNMDTQDTLAARCCEWMVFKKKPLYLDRTRFRYQINAFINGNKVRMQVTQISYYYGEDNEGSNGYTIRAEEWITDKEALNKAHTKLYPKSGKFRRLTVDRVEEIFEGAMDAFEAKQEPIQTTPAKKVRTGIVED